MPSRMRSESITSETPPLRAVSVEKPGIVFAFVALACLAYYRNVNWDEFYFLSHVHAWVDGRLDRPLQTVFVHAFRWLTWLPGNEWEQIFAGRLVMALCLAATTCAVFCIARHLTSPAAAGLASLAFLSSGYVLAHGGSFRADPIAAALLTSSLAMMLITQMRWWQGLIAATLLACAFLVTIKSVLYLPAFLGVLIWRWSDRAVLARILIAGVLSLGLAAALFLLHAAQITPAAGIDARTNAADAATTALLNTDLFPRSDVIFSWAMLSVPQLFLVGIGLASARRSRLIAVLILFAVPILSVVIYRNAFPYFFPFAAPLLMVAAAVGANKLSIAKRTGLMLAMILGAMVQLFLIAPENARAQRATIAEVHRLFEAPVPYIDAHGMIGSFPSASFFMSTWELERYNAAGKPVLAEAILREQPPLLLAQRRVLNDAMLSMAVHRPEASLLPADAAALRATYVHYSGNVWLAGTEIQFGSREEMLSVPFAGTYRIETNAEVRLNGALYRSGDVTKLDQTQINAEGTIGTTLRLVWDTGVAPVARNALERDYYAGFLRLVF